MNIFEDLVIELKEQNLLEEIFIGSPSGGPVQESSNDVILSTDAIYVPTEHAAEQESGQAGTKWASSAPDQPTIQQNSATPLAGPGTVESADLQFLGSGETVEIRKPMSEREFFKKRAAGEMSSLKMVDAVLSAVERERLKVVPLTYDDLEAKKALHAFMQVADDDSGDDHKAAEFRLLSETQIWCSALADRDRNILVSHLRVYCENCKPKLSSVAMLALARFYRNLPYSDAVRAKFDFIMTRLFSKPHGEDKRNLLFTHEQTLAHIKTLYADWSSIPLYATDDDDANILLTALSFEELASESEMARSFDDLIKSDFFGRLRLFKENIAETYFAPPVTAAAIECNIRMGNRYVDLIGLERTKMDADRIHERFAELDDQTISEAAGRSLGLSDILRQKGEPISAEEPVRSEPELPEPSIIEDVPEPPAKENFRDTVSVVEKTSGGFLNGLKADIASVNHYFLAGSLLLVVLSVGVYVWANYFVEAGLPSDGVKTLSFQGTDIGEHVRTARLSGDTLYLVSQPTFGTLGKEQQIELLQQFLKAGSEKGWSKVNILNSSGQTVGFASANRTELYQP
jgi:hypothetical protein